jgi:long-chain acyl-CoA synthetase
MAETANIAEALLEKGRDEAPAIIDRGRITTYGELRADVAVLASELRGGGAGRGERIGLFSENSAFFVTAYLATIRAGFCAIPFQLDLSQASFERIVQSAGMSRVLVSKRHTARVAGWAESARVEVLGEEALVRGPDAPMPDLHSVEPPVEVDPESDLASIVFTSGSTGDSKGVMVTHRNIAVNTEDIVGYLGLGESDRVMAVLPFYYCYGVSLLHTHLSAGGSLVINNQFMFPEKVLDDLEAQECTGFAGVPSTYQILLRKTRFAERRFPRLRWLQQAGGRLPNSFIEELCAAQPGADLFIMYGQTEATARLSYLPPEHLDRKLGSIGRGLPHTRLEVLKADGNAVEPGSEEIGEIVASGENITAGYWGDPEETKLYYRGGRLHTGDMARVDEEGFVFVVDRSRDFIKSMGNRVSAKEVEDAVAAIPEVVEVAVIGVPHEVFGEAIVAFVVCVSKDSADREAIRKHCMKQLPNFKMPTRIELRESLPKTGSAKIDKAALRAEEGS